MGMTRNIRLRTGLIGLLGGSLLLTGCMGPTYGTGKTAGEQLVDDIGNAVTLRPDDAEKKNIRYQPRGGLVVPKDEIALTTPEQTAAYRDARRLQMGAYSDKRRYLSDPPVDYRRLPEEASADLGEPERTKERRRKKEAKAAKQSGSAWWPF